MSHCQSQLQPVSEQHPLCHPPRRIGRIFILLVFLLSLVGGSATRVKATTITFTAEELLGKPTDTSITINIVPASAIEYRYQYGTTAGGPYPNSTLPVTAAAGQPHEVVITGLSPNTRYYYRMLYDGDGDVEDGDFEVRTEHSFWTQRAAGSTFIFTVTSDSHATFNTAHQNAMTNILNDQPGFPRRPGRYLLSGERLDFSDRSQQRLPGLPRAAVPGPDRPFGSDLPVVREPRGGRGLESGRYAFQHRPGEHPGPQGVLPTPINGRILFRQHGSPGRPSTRRPTATSSARTTMPGRGAMRCSWSSTSSSTR